jgi:6-pyruvoyltetrahydropterin/6-carboxytetrahydropterin synthase
MSYSVTKTISFCYGHRLLRYEGKCRHLHGHNGRAEITVRTTQLDPRGMVIDFGDIKKTIGSFIDDHLDHKILLCKDDPLLPKLKEMKEAHFVMEDNPTAENIAKLIYESARNLKLPVVSVKLWETDTSFAVYEG